MQHERAYQGHAPVYDKFSTKERKDWMEIMHSKFLKLQTALLSVLLLFSVLLPQTALAAGGTTNAAAAQDTVTLVDPDTFNS